MTSLTRHVRAVHKAIQGMKIGSEAVHVRAEQHRATKGRAEQHGAIKKAGQGRATEGCPSPVHVRAVPHGGAGF